MALEEKADLESLEHSYRASSSSGAASLSASSILPQGPDTQGLQNTARPRVGILMWERKTITELTGCHSPTWEVKSRCLTRGEYFIVSYFLIFSIKIIDGGGEEMTH